MFIVFEGLDGSGKTTLSKILSSSLNITRTRLPTFSSEEADRLNLRSMNTYKREVTFLMDHIKHQSFIRKYSDIVCDRYVWSARTYSKVNSREIHDFLEMIYADDFFREPDVYVFVDTSINQCAFRRPGQRIEDLERLHQAYLETWPKKTKVIKLVADGSPDEAYKELYKELTPIWPAITSYRAIQEDVFQQNDIENEHSC